MKIDHETLLEYLKAFSVHAAKDPDGCTVERDGVKFPVSTLVDQAIEELEALPAQVDRLDKLEEAVAQNRSDIISLKAPGQSSDAVHVLEALGGSSPCADHDTADLVLLRELRALGRGDIADAFHAARNRIWAKSEQ